MEVYMIQFQFSEEILTEARRAISRKEELFRFIQTPGSRHFSLAKPRQPFFVATVSCPR